jgi:cytochrome P450
MLSDFAARRALSAARVPHSWPTPANRKADRARRRLWGIVEELIAKRRGGSAARDDLLGPLLAARDPHSAEVLDDDALRDQALTFLIAGHETTGTTLAFALHLLGRHEREQERVRAEVRPDFGGPFANAQVRRGAAKSVSPTSHAFGLVRPPDEGLSRSGPGPRRKCRPRMR